jgi:hypothetical protein
MGYEYDKIQGNYPVVWLPDLPKSDKKVIKCPLFVIEVFQVSTLINVRKRSIYMPRCLSVPNFPKSD